MPQTASIQDIISNAVSQAVQRITPAIQKRISELAAGQLEAELKVRGRGRRNGSARGRARARPQDLTKWIADSHARRVPKFVIQMTGLDTKKKIVARFGPNAAFEKGKPPPKSK